jgi:Leucine-rich repeat (LRR) protein
MPFSIKYSLETDTKKFSYNSFHEIEQLERYNDIMFIDCSSNELTSLPEHLPDSLQKLDCGSNELTSLPEHLPDSLQEFWCINNKLTSLPEHLPDSLQKLHCYSNKLTSLPEYLPSSLQKLHCGSNELTSLPNSIIHCINLRFIRYENNEIEYIPPHIVRFLNRMINNANDIAVYNDGQNVHNHQIQQSIRDSIYSVMSGKPILTIDETVVEIIKSPILTEPTKQLIMEYCEDDSIHSVLNITFKELMVNVWNIIRSHKEMDNILCVLNDEINDANCKCFTGRMSRLINCLNGFDDRVSISIADNSQIGNIIILVRQKLESENQYSVSHHKELVREELIEHGYDATVISEWIEYIE